MISITKVCSDGDWIESKDQSSDGIRLVQTGNVGNGVYLDKTDRSKFVSEETFSRLRCTEIFPGDVLVSRLPDPIGRACIIPQTNQKMITAVDCTILRFDETKCLPNYFVFFSRSNDYHFQIEQSTFGATRQRVSRKNLEQIKIPLPSLPEQQKIAAHLDSIQSAIDNKKQQLQQLDELVKSKFVEMFHDKGFSKKKIGEIISISRGASPRPISAFVTNDLDGINWIKIGDVSEDSLYIEKTSERITKEGADKSRYVKPGDFILSNSMSFGRPYILKIYGCVHDGWLILSNYENTFNPLFLYYELRDDEVQSQFDGSANGATVRNLNSDIVKSIDVVVPPIELQNTFAEYVQKIDSAKAIIKTQLVDLQELLDSKMDEYFGE